MVVGRGYKSRVVGVGNGLKIKEKREKSLPRKKVVLKTLKGKDNFLREKPWGRGCAKC